MAFSKMIDMAKEPEDLSDPIPETSATPSAPQYPYGLCIALTEEELAKLGLDDGLPEVGMMIHLSAMAKVTSVSQNERETSDGGKKNCCRVELQITHLAAENEDEEDAAEERRERFYGGEKEEAA